MNPDTPPGAQQPAPNQYPTSPSPISYAPASQPVVVSGGSGGSSHSPHPSGNGPVKPNKAMLWSVIGGAVGLLLIVGLAVLLASGSKTPAPKAAAPAKTSQTIDAEAATPTSTQVINDSVSQDISSLNDEQDFPATQLDDKALGL